MSIGAVVFSFLVSLFWALLLTSEPGYLQVSLGHAFVILAGSMAVHAKFGGDPLKWNVLFAILLGPLSIFAALAYAAAWLFGKTDRQVREAWYEELRGGPNGQARPNITREIDAGRIDPARASSWSSVRSALAFGDLKERQQVLLWIARRKDERLLPLVKDSLTCNDAMIRSQAASLLAAYREPAVKPASGASLGTAYFDQGPLLLK